MTLRLPLFILFTLPLSLQAENHMLIIGGSGDPQCIKGATSGKNAKPDCDKTIFDTGMNALAKNIKNSNWKYQISFNGGHAETENLLRNNFPRPVAPTTSFSEDSYKKIISEYKEKILSGKITSNDQLIIMINSHGALKQYGEISHTIAAGAGEAKDLKNLKDSKTVNLDDLKELIELTKSKGIKLGIVDLSCHSGSTLALKNNAPNTCIISATSPKHYAYADNSPNGMNTFSTNFVSRLKPGVTLEAAFLEARTNSKTQEYPMISTSESDEILAEVYQNITPYLYHNQPGSDKLNDYILASLSDQQMCLRESQFRGLISKIESLQDASTGTPNGFNKAELKRLITEYKKIQDESILALRKVNGHKLEQTESFSIPTMKGARPLERTYSWREILQLDNVDEMISQKEKMIPIYKNDPEKQAEFRASAELYRRLKERRKVISAAYPNLKTFEQDSKMILSMAIETTELSEKIALQEKKFYDELYRKKQSLNFNDPCRRITF